MPLPIQRVPRGLSDVLSIFGGEGPRALNDQISGVLELLQFYALQQRTVLSAQNGALAEGGVVTVQMPAQWCLVTAVSAVVVKTGTMTACRLSVAVNRGVPNGPPLKSESMGPFGATETGTVDCVYIPVLPLVCPPNSQAVAGLNILGTDATANVFCVVEFGVLG